MRVELLYADGDRAAMPARQNLVEVLTEDAFESTIQMVSVASDEDAAFLDLRGSPTIRIDGVDLPADPLRLLADRDLARRRGEHDRERLRRRGDVGDGAWRQGEDGPPSEAGGEHFLDHEKPPRRAEEVCWAGDPPERPFLRGLCSSAWSRRPGSSPEGA